MAACGDDVRLYSSPLIKFSKACTQLVMGRSWYLSGEPCSSAKCAEFGAVVGCVVACCCRITCTQLVMGRAWYLSGEQRC